MASLGVWARASVKTPQEAGEGKGLVARHCHGVTPDLTGTGDVEDFTVPGHTWKHTNKGEQIKAE